MSHSLDELKRQMESARDKAAEFTLRSREREKEYAVALADSLGIRIGTILRVRGHIVRRFSVVFVGWKGYGNPPLRINGVAIRKDGTRGREHEIWQDFDIEPEPEMASLVRP